MPIMYVSVKSSFIHGCMQKFCKGAGERILKRGGGGGGGGAQLQKWNVLKKCSLVSLRGARLTQGGGPPIYTPVVDDYFL